MTLIETFERLKNISRSRINTQLTIVPSASSAQFVWENNVFVTEQIRYGHIEYFKSTNNKVEVVHAMCYPQFNIAYPIFGFDAIALNGQVTGVFCDATPSPYDVPSLRSMFDVHSHQFKKNNRQLPEWAGFFSGQFLALAPDGNLDEILSVCLNLFEKYLYFIFRQPIYVPKTKTASHKTAQNKYSMYQQQNTKTIKALTAYIGETEARKFISEVLFPIAK